MRPRLFPRYLQYLLMDFRQTFAIGVSWEKDELIISFGVKRSKVKVILSRRRRPALDAVAEFTFLYCVPIKSGP